MKLQGKNTRVRVRLNFPNGGSIDEEDLKGDKPASESGSASSWWPWSSGQRPEPEQAYHRSAFRLPNMGTIVPGSADNDSQCNPTSLNLALAR
jgi:hypothetical protein